MLNLLVKRACTEHCRKNWRSARYPMHHDLISIGNSKAPSQACLAALKTSSTGFLPPISNSAGFSLHSRKTFSCLVAASSAMTRTHLKTPEFCSLRERQVVHQLGLCPHLANHICLFSGKPMPFLIKIPYLFAVAPCWPLPCSFILMHAIKNLLRRPKELSLAFT